MKMLTTLGLALIFGASMIGCDKQSGKKVETTVTTPEGETKVTEEVKVEKSGEAADEAKPIEAAPADPAAPATTPADPATPPATPEGTK